MQNVDKVKAAAAAKRTAAIGILSGVAIFAYGLWISRSHITHIGYALELSRFEAETLFVLVDFLALYGKVLMSRRLSAKTRRYGFKVMLAGLAMSTGCNVASGLLDGRFGAAFYGLFVVVIIVIVEIGVSITKAKTVSTEIRVRAPKAPAEALTPRQLAARKGAETKRRNAAMPVSPGMGPVGEYAGRTA